MAYTHTNFKSKKALKEAVRDYNECHTGKPGTRSHYQVTCYQPGLGPDLTNFTGRIFLQGPHYPAANTWEAEVELINGLVVKVKT